MRFDNEKELYLHIGSRIKHFRESKNLTQQQLCEISGISISYLSKLEAPNCEKSVSLALLNDLVNVLNIEWSQLFEEDKCSH